MSKALPHLSRERILQASLQILEEHGLAGLSMRKLAAALDVEAMSLYNHVRDKRDLLNGLTDLVLSQVELPDAALPWNERLETIALNLYHALLRTPALVTILASEQGSPSALKVMRGMDALIAALAETGLNPQQQVHAYRGLLALCIGSVFAHTMGLTKTAQQAQEVWDQWETPGWDAQELPHLARLGPAFGEARAEEDFRFMLRAYISYLG